MDDFPVVIFLMGPTAAGKTALALEIARSWPVEIISVDAAQVYRGMDIGTAKPDAAELARVPHHLIDILDPAESYSAARFSEDARRIIPQILERGRVPLLVGGTMFYFRALERGLSPLPSAQPELRAALLRDAAAQGWPAMHERLAAIDPQRAARIDPHDAQRIQRALEIHAVSGQAPSQLGGRRSAGLPNPIAKFALLPAERSELHRRIEQRFAAMVEAGLVEEVRRLRARDDLHPQLPAMRCVGYRQVLGYLAGEYSREEMLRRGIYATRQLAKRQLTWLRGEPGLTRFYDPSAALDGILGFLAGGGGG